MMFAILEVIGKTCMYYEIRQGRKLLKRNFFPNKFKVSYGYGNCSWIMRTTRQQGLNSFMVTKCHKAKMYTCVRNYDMKNVLNG